MKESLQNTIKELPKTVYGVALKAWFEEELEKINDVSTITGDVIEKGRKLEGRQHAERLVKAMLRKLGIDKVETPVKFDNEYK